MPETFVEWSEKGCGTQHRHCNQGSRKGRSDCASRAAAPLRLSESSLNTRAEILKISQAFAVLNTSEEVP